MGEGSCKWSTGYKSQPSPLMELGFPPARQHVLKLYQERFLSGACPKKLKGHPAQKQGSSSYVIYYIPKQIPCRADCSR